MGNWIIPTVSLHNPKAICERIKWLRQVFFSETVAVNRRGGGGGGGGRIFEKYYDIPGLQFVNVPEDTLRSEHHKCTQLCKEITCTITGWTTLLYDAH